MDFAKAFNRIDHNLLITKLSDMGVPGWLLKVVMGFLTNRRMIIRYKGKTSSIKRLPGGGPQGTLLGLFLFLILINEAGFEVQENNAGELLTTKRNMKRINQIHLKFVDDLTLAESINLPAKLQSSPDSPEYVLPSTRSVVYDQLLKTEQYARTNQMKINFLKTKIMVFNPCWSLNFSPKMTLGGHELEVVEEVKLLGVIIRSDLKWSSNTGSIVRRAANKLWIIRRLKNMGANTAELIDMYSKHCRSILEYAVPVWNGALTGYEKKDIERVQKMALHIIFDSKYLNYQNAMEMANLETLEDRRTKLCMNFAKKAEKSDRYMHWFRPRPIVNTRQASFKYSEPIARTDRLKNSAIPYLTRLLNQHYQK